MWDVCRCGVFSSDARDIVGCLLGNTLSIFNGSVMYGISLKHSSGDVWELNIHSDDVIYKAWYNEKIGSYRVDDDSMVLLKFKGVIFNVVKKLRISSCKLSSVVIRYRKHGCVMAVVPIYEDSMVLLYEGNRLDLEAIKKVSLKGIDLRDSSENMRESIMTV